MAQPLFDGAAAPLLGFFLCLLAAARGACRFERLTEDNQPLRGIGPPVQEHILDQILQLRIDFFIDLQHAGIHNTHVHARGDGVIQKRCVHGLAHFVVAAETERDVRHAAANLRVRQVLLDPARGADEIDRVVVVLLHARGHGEDVGIEDDVFRRKIQFVHKQAIGALADADFLLVTRGLALFVKGHHHRGCAVLQNRPRVLAELRLALFERNRIHNALALHAFQAGLNHFPL